MTAGLIFTKIGNFIENRYSAQTC